MRRLKDAGLLNLGLVYSSFLRMEGLVDDHSPHSEPDTYVFIVRLWREAVNREDELQDWRGSIEQVGHPQRVYFTRLSAIMTYIRERTATSLRRTPSWLSEFIDFFS